MRAWVRKNGPAAAFLFASLVALMMFLRLP
jgi:hypothetical protein